MSSVWIAVIGILGTLSASLLTQWLQSRTVERQGQKAERQRVGDLRRDSMATFADALMSFRRAQLQNWHVARQLDLDPDDTDVAPELRDLRARTWAAFYRVQLLWNDPSVVTEALRLVDAVTELKNLDEKSAVGESADRVRTDLSAVMDQARTSLLTEA